MGSTQHATTTPFATAFDGPNPKHESKDDWEDWEDEDANDDGRAPVLGPDGFLIDLSDETTTQKSAPTGTRHVSSRSTQPRFSVQKPHRVKSKGRQKAQNAKAGITLVTDMSQFRQAQRSGASPHLAYDVKQGKFVDNTALLALEGEPTSASIGSFSWLKRKPGNIKSKKSVKKGAQNPASDLSPVARPIVIGFSVPSDDAGDHQVSPQTTVVETPVGIPFSRKATPKNGPILAPQQQRSVWSPDTEDSESPFSATRSTSSIYSRPSVFDASVPAADAPPVPALPATMKFKQTQGAEMDDDDDAGTPCTLFEEDGSPTANRKSQKPKGTTISPESATSRGNGWWDHVTTPFMPQPSNNPFRQQPQNTGASSSTAPQDWWQGVDDKRAPPSRTSGLTVVTPAAITAQATASSSAPTSNIASSSRPETHSEKAQVLLEENQSSDLPPPYEPTQNSKDVKFTAIYPPSHFASNQPIPSPGPMTPGLPGTMTSQGDINLREIPLTPSGVRTVPAAALPDRLPGSYVTGDHFYDASGRANKTERQRRRHEKEDAVARKVEGFWRGRGFMSDDGCFGRTGREGRKRRRVCLGVCGGVIAAIILAVVLAVVLTHNAMASSSQRGSAAPDTSSTSVPYEAPAFWLNLTDFPPMPTGVFTVTGPNNSVAVSDCFADDTPSTAWSCALPKGQLASDAPFPANQPEFIFQIQFDNTTEELWKLWNETQPSKTQDEREFQPDPGFSPQPSPPSLAEIFFLGNTTDHVKSDNKAGDPTPFFVSLLETVDETVGPDMLERRQGPNNAIGGAGGNGTSQSNITDSLPAPTTNADGTGAPARLFPRPVQQPVRLFDRGLPTERYAFYSYFDKDIYLANATSQDKADADGGSEIQDADALVTFTQTRFLVQIWTRKPADRTAFLGNGDRGGLVNANTADDAAQQQQQQQQQQQPGTMPYPVTITVDMHGGSASEKIDFRYGVDAEDGTIDTEDAKIISVDRGAGGSLVSPFADPDLQAGGIDGGTGGCRCEWVNFQTK
ncbi:hypothetical protein F4780DRAFT_737509 [Xylariomycetidae sp. FL0641]|nr:hypothetical protein F4780DRAFT_737509 [Xylariomycetidae sp. FL0641]